jgi:outer membrane autotransporter protein
MPNNVRRQQRRISFFGAKRRKGRGLVARPRGERDWLMRSSALAGGVLAAAFFLPSGEAMAAGLCVDTGSPATAITCTGTDTDRQDYTGGNAPGADFSFILDDYTNTYSGSTDPAFHIDATAGNGNFTVNDGSGIDHSASEEGVGVEVDNIGGSLGVNIGSSVGGGAYVIGTRGVELHGTGSGSVEVINFGSIEGVTDTGLSTASLGTEVTNHALVLGATTGAEFTQPSSVDYDNRGGTTAGIDDQGIDIFDGTSGSGIDVNSPAVRIRNGDGGVIVGGSTGLWVESIHGTVGGSATGVRVENGGNGTDDPGGLIFGESGDGITVIDVNATDGGGDVYIGNENTYNSAAGGIDLTGLDERIWNSDLASGLATLSEDGVTTGIIGGYNGVYASDIGGQVTVYSPGGFILGLSEDGINVNEVDGKFDEESGTWKGLTVENQNGLVWGGEDGVSSYDVGGNVYVGNKNGTIFSPGYQGAAVSIIDTYDDHGEDGTGNAVVTVYNGGGTIESWNGDAIRVLGIYSHNEDGYEDLPNGIVRIENGDWTGSGDFNLSTDTYANGGTILGLFSAIVIGPDDEENEDGTPREVRINNGTGGAILGSGSWGEDGPYDFGPTLAPVVSINTVDYMTDAWANTTIVNNGLMSSWQVPHFQADQEYSSEEGVGALPNDTIDLAAIQSDMTGLSSFVASGGRSGSIANLADYAGAAQGLLVVSANSEDAEDTGAANIFNSGVMVGNLQLWGETFNASEDGWGENYLQNRGVWLVTNQQNEDGESNTDPFAGPFPGSTFGWPYDEDGIGDGYIENAGLIQTAFRADHAETTYIAGVWDFVNGSYWNGTTDEDGASVDRNGVISMVDGGSGDQTYIAARYFDGAYTGDPLTSFIAVDTTFQPNGEGGVSDVFNISASAVYGSTGIIVHRTDTVADGVSITSGPILVVTAGEDGNYDNPEDGNSCYDTLCKAGDTFYISDKSDGYINVNGIGAIQKGFYAWYLTEQGDPPDPDFSFISAPAPTADQLPGVVTGTQNIFYDVGGVVADHIYGNHFPAAGSGGADLAVDGSGSTGGGADKALWAKISGSWFDTDTSVEQTILGSSATVDTSFKQNTWNVLGGADFSPTGEQNGWRFGLYGGYTQSGLSFDSYGATADYKGGVVGGYAAYTRGGFYADGEVIGNFLGVTYKDAGIGSVDANANSVGVLANTGYRIDNAWGFVEPIASFSYVNTSIDNMSSDGGTVDFSNGQSLRAGAGGRIGTSFGAPGGIRTEVSVLGKVWNEFEDANRITVTDGLGNSESFSDNISGVFGEVQAMATVYSASRDWSGFVSGGAKFNSAFTAWDAKAGIRKTF